VIFANRASTSASARAARTVLTCKTASDATADAPECAPPDSPPSPMMSLKTKAMDIMMTGIIASIARLRRQHARSASASPNKIAHADDTAPPRPRPVTPATSCVCFERAAVSAPELWSGASKKPISIFTSAARYRPRATAVICSWM